MYIAFMCVCINVCLSVHDGSGMFVGWDYTSDAQPLSSIYGTLNSVKNV